MEPSNPVKFAQSLVWILLAAFSSAPGTLAIEPQSGVHFVPQPGDFPLATAGHSATLFVDPADDVAVRRAAQDLQADIERVTGHKPILTGNHEEFSEPVVLLGTLGHSALLDNLVATHKLDASAIAGHWESTLTAVVSHPWPGVDQALVIAGSDRRGTIYGIYDLSKQIGVSPWYWWADVPVRHHDSLFISPRPIVIGEPAVRYRGIFLNDEAPALTGWTDATFGGRNHLFYSKVFELILRLRGNCLWPAMWTSAFNEDDPLNASLANDYGIVMGTSHHEPMLRSQQEWKRHGVGPWDYTTNARELNAFWDAGIERNKNYESIITLGMRGDGDLPMSQDNNVSLLERIVHDQRAILARHNTPTLESDPKVWALYKEVQGYYEKGMRVPDDITLLWCDDNWGNLRRVPTAAERNRAGGAGIYYHFDYVGDPRNYKWIDTNSIAKVREQMNLAYSYGATRLWIVNVGDLKPMEFPIEFFLAYAWNPDRWNQNSLDEFATAWATREFGPEHAAQIASLMLRYERYIARRKPELLAPDTYSLINYHEADRVEAEWAQLVTDAETIGRQLPPDAHDAFFELVQHRIQAASIVTRMYIAAARNHLYAAQGRISTNDYADQTRLLFAEDAALTSAYNRTLANGKWNHMMDQVHIGYTYWNDPLVNTMPAVQTVEPAPAPHMGVSVEGDPLTSDHWEHPLALPPFEVYQKQTHDLTLFNTSHLPYNYTLAPSAPWILPAKTSGTVSQEETIGVRIDWNQLPVGTHQGFIRVASHAGVPVIVRITATRPSAPAPDALDGFVETNSLVSIEAEHTSSRTSSSSAHWITLPWYGQTLSGVTIEPSTAPSATSTSHAPELDYRIYFASAGDLRVHTILAPSLNIQPDHGLRYSLAFDDAAPVVLDALKDNSDAAWSRAVSDGVRKVETTLHINTPGYHTLRVRMVDPNVVFEKFILSRSPLPYSYLGPPESFHRFAAQN